jgi:integrase
VASITKRGIYWRGQIIRRGYPHQFKTFDTHSEAEAWARSVEHEMDRGIFASRNESASTTLSDALERYWHDVASHKSHPNQERQRILRWQQHPLAHYFIGNLRGQDFAKYRDARLAQGRASNTVRLELAIISHLFEIARKEWGMENLQNPLKNIRKPSGSNERDRRLLTGEFERIFNELSRRGNPYAAPAFILAIETGLRQGMLFRLRWEWVDLNARIINIPTEYRRKGNKGVPPALPLSTKAIAALKGLSPNTSGEVFATTANAVVMIWKKSMTALDIHGLRWHDLRHEAASRMFEKGLNPIEVASVTGHKNLNTLRRYTHLAPSSIALKLG